MRQLLITLFTLSLFYSCSKSSKNPADETQLKSKDLNRIEIDNGRSSYLEIKAKFNKGYYNDLDRQISQFYDKKQSPFLDSVKRIHEALVVSRKLIQHMRDSLTTLSASIYFNALGLPKLDSITGENYDVNEHSYTLDFIDFDKKLFQTDWDENWYLSRQQFSDSLIYVTVCHFRDCEFSIVLYSVDMDFKLIDNKEIFYSGCYTEPAPDLQYQKYLVNEYKMTNATYFHADRSFTVIRRTYFSLQDTIAKKVRIEIGSESNVTYSYDSVGSFRVIKDKSFMKEYVKPLYDVPI